MTRTLYILAACVALASVAPVAAQDRHSGGGQGHTSHGNGNGYGHTGGQVAGVPELGAGTASAALALLAGGALLLWEKRRRRSA